MHTAKFLTLIEDHPQKELIFAYGENLFVPEAYHITEIKNVSIESVDCGGFPHSEKQTVVQLWVDESESADQYMTTAKAAKIFQIVNNVKPISFNAPLFFEWGMKGLPTSTYQIDAIENRKESILVKLSVPPTVCKPRLNPAASKNTGTSCSGKGCC